MGFSPITAFGWSHKIQTVGEHSFDDVKFVGGYVYFQFRYHCLCLTSKILVQHYWSASISPKICVIHLDKLYCILYRLCLHTYNGCYYLVLTTNKTDMFQTFPNLSCFLICFRCTVLSEGVSLYLQIKIQFMVFHRVLLIVLNKKSYKIDK